ncbi:LexA-binding, inner membrane-associated putative hydrolase [Halorientalis persicus]|uniref:LexA-binding, inner membrane-associated putative hydrolase n=2 Tax=Halorientalis persicus TaxID=1367881 RepID=A0A1H8SXA7_9EURY|nr:LexA-binding, inner membrane-associated putative hydrolase [Halorientalis persicus]
MMPWGHLVIGYLIYSAGLHLWSQRSPAGGPTLVLAFATQFPDLLDKPLNWWFGILDGRGIGHSFLTMVPFCVAAYLVARRYDRGPLGAAFGVGVISHLPMDALGALLTGTVPERAPYLLWPLFPAPTYPKDSFWDHFEVLLATLQLLPWNSPVELVSILLGPELLFLLVPFSVWAYDGFPGVKTTVHLLTGGRLVENEPM